MAKATKIEAVTEVVVKVPEGIQLDLSKDEANILVSLLGECMSCGPTNGIYEALKAAGANKTRYVYNGMGGDRVRVLVLKPA